MAAEPNKKRKEPVDPFKRDEARRATRRPRRCERPSRDLDRRLVRRGTDGG